MDALRVQRGLKRSLLLLLAPTLVAACFSDWDVLDPRVGPSTAGSGDGGDGGAIGGDGGLGGMGAVGGSGAGASGGMGGTGGMGGLGDCGDGFLDPGEQCDDANDVDGDGCSACVVDCNDVGSAVAAKHPTTFHCYLYDAVATVGWDVSRQACEDQAGDLAVITSSEEAEFIKQSFDGATMDNVWVGLNDLDVEGTFEWIDGSPVSYTEWITGEPNDTSMLEDCTELRPTGWNDRNCTALLAYLCEIDPIVAVP